MNKIFGDTINMTPASCKSAPLGTQHRHADNAVAAAATVAAAAAGAAPRTKPRRKNRFKKKDAKASLTHTNYLAGPPDQRKSFAEIVRNNADECIVQQAIKPPNILPIEAGEVGALGYDFRTIDNSSVRSVLENLFREPDHQTTASQPSPSSSRSVTAGAGAATAVSGYSAADDVCSSCVRKRDDAPQPISMPPMGASILDNIFNEETSTFTNVQRHAPFTNGASNIVDFNYNLSALLYQRAKAAPHAEFASASDHPSAFFVCPRCGEMTNLQTSDLERLGSLGDRCIPNFNTRFQCNDIFSGQYSRRYTPPVYNQSTAPSNVFAFRKSVGRGNKANPFNGLNMRKKKSN